MFRLIVFDLDGVLVLSNRAHLDVCRKVLEKVGIRGVKDEEITPYFGRPYKEVLRAVMDDRYTEEKLEIASEYQKELLYSDEFLQQVEKIPGLRKSLMSLGGKGIRIAIASGNERAFLERLLRYLNLDGVFDLVISADDVKDSKPAPDMLNKAMEFLGINKEETLFVGDAKNDVLAAKNAGVKSAVVLTGILSRKEAEQLEADFILESIADIYRIQTK